MSKELSVSIIIPVYNREKLIVNCLESALNQKYDSFEVVVIDNASVDGTWDVLQDYAQKYSNLRIFRNLENIGPVRNWKRCIDEARGKYIKILWSDDWIDLNYLEETVKILESNDEFAFVYTPTIVHSNNKSHLLYALNRGKRQLLEKFVEYFAKGYLGYPSSPGNAIFRKQDVVQNLVIDIPNDLNLDFKRFGAGNDLLIFLNCYPKYKYFFVHNDPLSHFLAHKESFTESNDLRIYYLYAIYTFIKGIENKQFESYYAHNVATITFLTSNTYKCLRTSEKIKFSVVLLIAIGKLINLTRQLYYWYFYKVAKTGAINSR